MTHYKSQSFGLENKLSFLTAVFISLSSPPLYLNPEDKTLVATQHTMKSDFWDSEKLQCPDSGLPSKT